MKYQIKIEDQVFDVELHDLQARPIIAVVNGESIEVWPQDNQKSTPPYPTPTKREQPNSTPKAEKDISPRVENVNNSAVYAPIPGVIVSVAVQPGDSVEYGQELCVLEAMKMKNAIRATRAGVIETVLVSDGQQVKHHDILMEYTQS